MKIEMGTTPSALNESVVAAPPGSHLDLEKIREDFPILTRQVHGKPLVYFDTAASAQRPLAVIEAVDSFYRRHNANVHRGVHQLSQEATDLYEAAPAVLPGSSTPVRNGK